MLQGLPTWFQKSSKNQKRKLQARSAEAKRRQARVELLENRAMMAVDLSLTKVGENIHNIAPLEDVMTSNFFFGSPNAVRGYPGDNRPALRVGTDDAFGIEGSETVYISFSADSIASLGSQIDRAMLTVQSMPGGQFDASPGNPFTISAHAVDADPFTRITDIDQNPSGDIDWLDFYNNNILAADPAALTVVENFGAIRFDVTNLVKNWSNGSNTFFVIALTGKNDTSGNDFLHGIRNNNDTPGALGSTFLTVTTPPTYTVTVSNAGPDDATGVSVSDVVPAHFGTPTFISNGGTVVNGNDVQWTGLNIPAGGSIDLTYRVAEAYPGAFMAPSAANGAWDRPTTASPNPNATFQGWEAFSDPNGPNAPQVVPMSVLPDTDGAFGGGLGVSWEPVNARGTANVIDTSAASNMSFLTSGGNIYSFAGPITPRITVPNNIDGVAGDNTNGYTTIFLQVHSQGSALNPDTVRLNGTIPPTEYALTSRLEAGSAFGSALGDTWAFEFRVPGNADVYTLDFASLQESFSLDRVAVDTIWNPTATSAAEALSVGAPFKIVNFAQVTAADQADADSTPNNGTPNSPAEDDEATSVFLLGNTPPRITSNGGGNGASANFNENSTNAITAVTVVDPQVPAQYLTYSLSGDDAAKFNISPAGVLTFITPPDFESPADADGNNVYQVTVVVRDNGVPVTEIAGGTLLPGLADSQSLSITVVNVNEAPTDIVLSSATIAENAGVNAPVGTFSSVDPETGNTFTYTLVAGEGDTGNGAFNISGNTLRASANLDFETQSSYSVRVRSTDQGGLFFEEVFTITVTDAAELSTLFVTSLTQTSTGFIANFSQPLAAADLNLYGNAALGPADVTLVGATTGAIRGSLILNATNTQITFVATQTGATPSTASGILPNDTYTVTLRSAGGTSTDGFNSVTDAPLDGNADGTAGDNFTTTFVVNNPADAVRVSIPDFARGHGQSVDAPNTSTGLPIFLSTGQNVSSLQFTLNYDPSLLNVTGFTPNSTLTGGGVSFTVNTSTPGVAIFNITHSTEFSTAAGALTLGTLTANVPTTAVYGAKHVLDITSLTVFDNDPGIPQERVSIGDDAVHVSAYFGDASGNRQIQSNDGTLLSRVNALLDTGFAAYQLADPTIIADISGNNQLQSNDGTLLARYSALINTPQIPTLPAAPEPLPSLAIDPILRIGSTAVASGATTVTVPVTLTVPATETAVSGVSSFQLLVSFDNTQLSFTTASGFSTTGAATTGWSVTPNQIVNTSPNTNTLVFIVDGGANPGPTSAISPGQTITLGSLTFTIQGGVSGPVNVNLLGSYQSTTTTVFMDDFATELQLLDTNGNPAPTNGFDPDNDGVITIGLVNLAPTAVSVTPNPAAIAENTAVPTNLLVGTIDVTDDGQGTNTLTLTGADSSFFTIVGSQLFLNAGTSLNFEAKPFYTVTVQVDDTTVGSTPDATTSFTLNVTNVNEAPTDIALSSTTIAENAGVNAPVGDFSTVDPDAGNTFTYTLVAGAGDTGNGAFNISGNTLRANASFDFDVQNSYSIRVRSTDQGGEFFEEVFTISVANTAGSVDLSITKTGANVHTIAPLEDVVASIHLSAGDDPVRGYAGENRPTLRVSNALSGGQGAGPETVYISFSAATIAALGSQIDRAILTVMSVGGGFGSDASPGNPFTISAHAVNADPFTRIIDNNAPSGDINWRDFYNNNILDADPTALTVVKDFGSLRFDVTNLVKNWANGSNTILVIALTGKNDLSGFGFHQGIANNNNSPASLGSTFLTVTTPTTYSVTVNNAGPDAATGVSVSDVVPNYFGTPSAISNGGTVVNGNDVQWTGLSIPAGGSITLTYQVATASPGGFIAPTTDNGAWNRPTAASPNPNATFQAWESFASPGGPNAPATVPGPAFGGVAGDSWTTINPSGTPNAFDSASPGNGSFLTGGNIYSTAGSVTPRVVVPNNIDGVTGDNANGYTTILVQMRNGGTELNPDTILLNGTLAPTEFALIARTGSGMSASDTWAFEWRVPGNADSYTIDFAATGAHMSLDRIAVDTIWNPTATSAAEAFSVGAPFKLVNFAQVIAADQTDADSAPNNGTPNNPVEDDEAASTFRLGNTPPRITSNGGGSSGTATVSENSTAVTTITVVDPQAPTQFLTYSLSGTDAALFNISPDGVLTFITAPNFESPTDANGDNVYEVIVTAQDSGTPGATGLADSQSLTVTVTNVNEAPTIAPQTFSVPENSANGAAVGTVVASDIDAGDTQTFAITAGNDAGAFAINPNTGAITVANGSLLNFEGTPSYSLTVSVTDSGSLSASNTITINLTDVNEAPTIAPQTFSVPENSANGVAVGTVVAADVDAGDTATFAITAGNTGGAFAINPNTGVITVANSSALDFETAPTYSLTVSVTDGGSLSTSATITINLSNVNEAPTIAPQTFSVPENSANGTAVGTVVAADVDAGDTRTFAITAGNTGGAFAINPNTGAITVANGSLLNFEGTPTYSLTVSVTDAGSLSASSTITINLTDVVEVAGITVSPTSGLTTTEAGGIATFTIVLSAQPTANVTIPLTSNDTTEGTVSPASVTFTPDNWNVAQTITVTGVDDAIVDGPVVYSIVTGAATSTDPAYNGLDAADVTVTNADNEAVVPPGITVTPAAGLSTTEAGGVAAFTVVLNSQPTANVTISLTSSDTTEGTVSVSSLVFTPANWNMPQLVIVTGVDDAIVDGNVTYTIVTAAATSTDAGYNGINPVDVSLTNFDNDTASGNTPPTISDIADQTTNEDTPLTGLPFTVGDSETPAANLTVTATSSDTTLIPNANLTLGGSGTNRTINVTPAANQSGTATITVTVSDGTTTTSDTFTVTVNPVNDAPTLDAISNPPALPLNSGAQTINLTGITAGSGESQTLTVTATSSNPALIPNPTVTYTSPNSTGSLSFTPVAGQSGTAVITVTVTDDGGTAGGGVNTVTRTFTVTVSGSSITTPGFVDIIPDPEIPGGRLLVINGTSKVDVINVYRYGSNRTLVMVPLSGIIRYFDNSAFDRVLINGFAGSDRIVLDPFFSKPTTINGDAGDDIITAGAGNDVIHGGDGLDIIYGRGGDDFIYGDNGNDYLYGEDGNDVILGGNQDDFIWGGLGNDVLNGGAGTDQIYGFGGDDLIIGGILAQANSQSSLQTIQALWAANQPFNTRISSLASEINSTTVTNDNRSDWIYGNDGRDWFVDYALLDLIWDLNLNASNGDRRN